MIATQRPGFRRSCASTVPFVGLCVLVTAPILIELTTFCTTPALMYYSVVAINYTSLTYLMQLFTYLVSLSPNYVIACFIFANSTKKMFHKMQCVAVVNQVAMQRASLLHLHYIRLHNCLKATLNKTQINVKNTVKGNARICALLRKA